MQTHIASIEKNQKSLLKHYKAQNDKEDDEKEARKAIETPGDYENLKSKKHMSQNDDDKDKEAQNKKDEDMMGKMRRAIQAIAQEDDEKKREAMAKAAQDMMDENKKMNHDAQNNDDDDDKKNAQEKDDEKKEARIASLEHKSKSPIVANILKVAAIINPKEIKSITKDLKTASLDEVENLWDKHYKSFSASLGVKQSAPPARFVPFQMNASLDEVSDEDNMYTASTPKEYSQLDTEKLMERATEMYT